MKRRTQSLGAGTEILRFDAEFDHCSGVYGLPRFFKASSDS
jgi:hypothetical protein